MNESKGGPLARAPSERVEHAVAVPCTEAEKQSSDEALREAIGRKPWRTGKPAEEVDLDGMLIPWRRGQPVFLEITGLEPALAVFSSAMKLTLAMDEMKAEYDDIKTVSDGRSFLASIPREVPVIVDPWVTPERNTRYLAVLRS